MFANVLWVNTGTFLAHPTVLQVFRTCWTRLVEDLALIGSDESHFLVLCVVILLCIVLGYQFCTYLRRNS